MAPHPPSPDKLQSPRQDTPSSFSPVTRAGAGGETSPWLTRCSDVLWVHLPALFPRPLPSFHPRLSDRLLPVSLSKTSGSFVQRPEFHVILSKGAAGGQEIGFPF